MKHTILIALALCTLSQPSVAMYRCEGSDGGITFSDKACSERIGEKINLKPLPKAGWTANADDYYLTTPSTKRRVKKRVKSGQKSKRKLEERCWRKKQRLKKINWQRRKGYKPAKGERLREQRREVQAYLSKFCR